jgi:hypothetical protein
MQTAELTGIDAERDPDDGGITVTWNRGEDMISLVCRPNGDIYRIVSPGRVSEPVVKTNVMALTDIRQEAGTVG